MRKLFTLFAVLACVSFVACEENEDTVVSNPFMKLSSAANMNYQKSGGEGVIDYLVYRPDMALTVEVLCDADWITNLENSDLVKEEKPAPEEPEEGEEPDAPITHPNADAYLGQITFDVAVNETGADRAATIEVTYGTQRFTVNVRQGATEAVTYDYEFELLDYQMTYYDDFADQGVHNYFVMAYIKGPTPDGYLQTNDFIIQFDIYSTEAPQSAKFIPAGTYTFDANNTCAPGTMSQMYSRCYLTDATSVLKSQVPLVDGSVTVTANGFEGFVQTADDGALIHFTYSGSTTGGGEMPEPEPEQTYSTITGNVEFENVEVTAQVDAYGDYYSIGMDNYMVGLSSETHGLQLELLIPTGALLDGTYELVPEDGSVDPSKYYHFPGGVVSEGGQLYTTGAWYINRTTQEMGPLVECDLTIELTENGVVYTIDAVDDIGNTIKGSFIDPEATGTGGDQPSDALSNLTGDVTFEDVNVEEQFMSYGDHFGIGMNVFLGQALSDTHSMTFQLMTPGDAENLEGIYEVVPEDGTVDPTKHYFFAGGVNGSQITATWYINQGTNEMAPIVGGTIEIQVWASGITFYDIDVVDDAGNSIKGTFIGAPAVQGEDVEMAVEDGLLSIEDYGDGYEVGMQNYTLTLIEADGEGHGLMVDILLPFESESIAGTYISAYASESVVMGGTVDHVFVPGDNSLYFPISGGFTTGNEFVIEDGEITIEVLGNNEYSFTFDCVLDSGNTLVGTFKAVDMNAGAEASAPKTLAAAKKMMNAKTSIAPMPVAKEMKKIQSKVGMQVAQPVNAKSKTFSMIR